MDKKGKHYEDKRKGDKWRGDRKADQMAGPRSFAGKLRERRQKQERMIDQAGGTKEVKPKDRKRQTGPSRQD